MSAHPSSGKSMLSLPVPADKRESQKSRWQKLTFVLAAILTALLLGAGSVSSSGHIVPTITIVSVVTDQNVTIQTNNYPASQTFTVRMNYMGTKGINGEVVGTLDSGGGGTVMSPAYPIPDFLKGQQQIAIRLDSPQGVFSFNWFWNNTTDGDGGGSNGGSGGQPPATLPTLGITGVVRDMEVMVQANNFPPNQLFDVTMGPMYTQGIDGIKVGEMQTVTGGTFQEAFPIPPELKGSSRISIRVQTRGSDPYFAYNWFWNNTTN